MKKYGPWIVVTLLGLWVLSGLRVPRVGGEFNLSDFGRLPVLLNGRVQPVDSVARNSLMLMCGKQQVPGQKGLTAIEWLMGVTMDPELADSWTFLRVDHPDLRSLLKVPAEASKYLAPQDLVGSLEEIDRQARRASEVEAQARSTFEKAVVQLHYALSIYQRLKNSFRPADSADFSAELDEFEQLREPGIAAVRAREAGETVDEAVLGRFMTLVRKFDFLANTAYPLIVPPTAPEASREQWSNLGVSLIRSLQTGGISPVVRHYAAMGTAYRQDNAVEFNQALAQYGLWLEEGFQPELNKAKWERLYNHWRPFIKSTALYLLVFLLGCFSWFGSFQYLNRSAFYVLVLAFLVHSVGILFRMALEGRPPVTNLYSSAVFVGWGAVLLGLILERFYRHSVGLVMASAIGLITQIIAHNLSLGSDTMEMMRAVLDSNFWLATHVITVTLGYSATFVAGFLAIVYLLRGIFTRSLDAETRKAIGGMVYGIVCFATFFSFVGTVLGGIWADQSWGRFWGWDPKENGALIIVLWNAIILHARWGGLVRERGLMNLAIFGNIVTSFSWFGVNMLGVGLHSYGFMDSAFLWLMAFVASQLALIALGMLPERYWLSLRTAR